MKITATVAAFAALVMPAAAVIYPTPQMFQQWFGKSLALNKGGSRSAAFSQFRRDFIEVLGDKAKGWLNNYEIPEGQDFSLSEYPFFNVFPQYEGSVGQTADAVVIQKWEAPCFKTNVAFAKSNDDGSLTITITASEPSSQECSDTYVFATTSGIDLMTISRTGEYNLEWTLAENMSEADMWDLQNKGVRIFCFLNDMPTTIVNLIETLKMFIPMHISTVPPSIGDLNVEFIESYTQFRMPARDDGLVIIPESEIQSGDFFGIIRLDGLDPMLAWGMGSTTGHTTVALWIDGELFVCESTVVDSYWPTDGIQKTPYRQWVKQAHAADFQVVHVPLSEEARANFDEAAAVDFYRSVEGLEYGYHVMLWGWLDTMSENFPCLPPDYESNCFQWALVEPLFGLIDKAAPEVADLFWIEAWNKRLDTSDLRTPDLYMEAANRGMESVQIPIVPEQDSWDYNTTRYGEPTVGKSMVCCVFVCNVWKAAGVFGDNEINCGELTNWDDYSMAIFGDSYTQMMGKYQLSLNDFNSKSMFSHMAETCPSFPPDYVKPADC